MTVEIPQAPGASRLHCLQLDPAGATGSGPGTADGLGFPGIQRGRLDAEASEQCMSVLFRSVPLLRSVGAATGTTVLSFLGRWRLDAGAPSWGQGIRTFCPKLKLGSP